MCVEQPKLRWPEIRRWASVLICGCLVDPVRVALGRSNTTSVSYRLSADTQDRIELKPPPASFVPSTH